MTFEVKKFHNKMLGHDVEAVKLMLDMDVDTIEQVVAWVNGSRGHARLTWGSADEPAILLHTLGGWHVVELGEWIIYSKSEGCSGESQNIIDVIFEEIKPVVIDHTNHRVELIARICHDANRVIQVHSGDVVSRNWDDETNGIKASAVQGVLNALAGQSAEELHQSWCDFKTADGWVYGDRKSEKLKMHPCLVPYDELPAEQKLKDHLFQSIVKSFQDAELI